MAERGETKFLTAAAMRARLREFSPSVYFASAIVLSRWMLERGHLDLGQGLVIGVASVATAHLLLRRLPAQNLIGLFVVVVLFAGGLALTNRLLEIQPFFPSVTHRSADANFWTAPLLWFVLIANSRVLAKWLVTKIARLDMGYWIFAVTVVLTGVVAFAATHQWRPAVWQPALSTLLLVAATPWFLSKRPERGQETWQTSVILAGLLFW